MKICWTSLLACWTLQDLLLGTSANHVGRWGATEKIVHKITQYNSKGRGRRVSVDKACLKAHNKARALHKDTPPLKYDKDLARGAAEWALHLTRLQKLVHSDTRGQYGENLAYVAAGSVIFGGELTAVSPAQAVFAWYEESWEVNRKPQLYDYNSEKNPGSKHFTQVVWKDTTKVGCGVAVVEQRGMIFTYIVARYTGPGNYRGRFVLNVMPMRRGTLRPRSSGDLELTTKCVDYGTACEKYKAFCGFIEVVCACTCS